MYPLGSFGYPLGSFGFLWVIRRTVFAVLSIHTYPACHSTGSVIREMASFEDEEVAMIAIIILDEEVEEQKKRTHASYWLTTTYTYSDQFMSKLDKYVLYNLLLCSYDVYHIVFDATQSNAKRVDFLLSRISNTNLTVLPETLTLSNSKTIADQQKQIVDLESASKNSCITKLNEQNFRCITSK